MPKTKISHSVLLLCLIRTDGCWHFSCHPRTLPEVADFSLCPQHTHLLGPHGALLSYTVAEGAKTVFVVPSNGVQEVLPMWTLLGKLLSSRVNTVACATKPDTRLCHGCRGRWASSQPASLQCCWRTRGTPGQFRRQVKRSVSEMLSFAPGFSSISQRKPLSVGTHSLPGKQHSFATCTGILADSGQGQVRVQGKP